MSEANEITPSQAREWLMRLPDEHRAQGAAALRGAHRDGFFMGAGKLPHVNPFDTVPPEQPKRKRR